MYRSGLTLLAEGCVYFKAYFRSGSARRRVCCRERWQLAADQSMIACCQPAIQSYKPLAPCTHNLTSHTKHLDTPSVTEPASIHYHGNILHRGLNKMTRPHAVLLHWPGCRHWRLLIKSQPKRPCRFLYKTICLEVMRSSCIRSRHSDQIFGHSSLNAFRYQKNAQLFW